MSINNFIPELWSANILKTLEKKHVFAMLANRDYEGEIRQKGDTVKINMLGDITIGSYTKNTDISDPETLDDAQTTLLIDQQKYFNFQIDDIDKRQQNPKLMGEATRKAGYALAQVTDAFFAGKSGECGITRNASGSAVDMTSANVADEIAGLGRQLSDADVPLEGRFIVCQPWVIEKMVLAGLTTRTDNTTLWSDGFIERILGFDIYQSTNVEDSDSAGANTENIAGIRGQSFTYAEQILDVEAYRPEKRFADALKGLHVYGGKIIRPDMTAVWWADYTAEA